MLCTNLVLVVSWEWQWPRPANQDFMGTSQSSVAGLVFQGHWQRWEDTWRAVWREQHKCMLGFLLYPIISWVFSVGADIHLSNGSSDVTVLKISSQLDTLKNVMTHLIPNVKKPSESSKLLDSETLQEVFEVVKQMIDTLVEVGNICKSTYIAWRASSQGAPCSYHCLGISVYRIWGGLSTVFQCMDIFTS